MAHKGGGGSHGGGTGIDSLAPPTGQFTAIGAIFMVVGAAWLAVRHPGEAVKCVYLGVVFTGLTGGNPNPIAHPLLGLAALIAGCCIVGADRTTK